MLFNEQPMTNTNIMTEDINKSSDVMQTSLEHLHRQNQIQESFEQNNLASHDNILVQNEIDNQEQDDTFKIDNQNHVEPANDDEMTEELPENNMYTQDDRNDG